MEVILLERIAKLGQMGDVVRVKDGFARNFLLPKGKALRASEANRSRFETMKIDLEARNLQQRGEAEKVAEKLNGQSFTVLRQAAEGGQLYGSVAVRDLVEALVAEKHKVNKSQIILDRPIKAIGVYEVRVALHPEVAVTVKVNVARSPEEADMQAQGVDVMAAMFEKDDAGFIETYYPNAEPGEIAVEAAPTETEGDTADG